jgi:cell cycle checkpoint control protein RAD9A
LKRPLHTSVAIDIEDFEAFSVEEKIHTGINVKDFKAIVLHAETLKASITALYSHPTRPMQLSYIEHGMECEFTLMTIGEYRGGPITAAPAITRPTSARPPSKQSVQGLQLQENNDRSAQEMPPPLQPASRSFGQVASQRIARPSPPPPRASVNEESLFVTEEDDEDRVWGAGVYEEDEGELRWVGYNNILSNADRTRNLRVTCEILSRVCNPSQYPTRTLQVKTMKMTIGSHQHNGSLKYEDCSMNRTYGYPENATGYGYNLAFVMDNCPQIRRFTWCFLCYHQ